MDKRFQVFVSSTFEDLKDERQAALRAILELDHMPAGMELFPAVDDDAWQLIKDVIDASDYYALIIGGRYGSQDETGIGYTEKEYDYAVASQKPVIALLHKNPNNLSRDRTDTDDIAWKKLSAFRAKVEKKHTCVFWEAPDELKARLIVSLTAMTKRRPAVGWIRADKVPSSETVEEILALRNKVIALEAQLASTKIEPPPGTDDLAQGSEPYEITVSFVARLRGEGYPYPSDSAYEGTIAPTWDEIFAAVAPSMIDEASDPNVRERIAKFIQRRTQQQFEKDTDFADRSIVNVGFNAADIETCLVQLRALGLIRESIRKRSLKVRVTYWALTPFGDAKMVALRALRRGQSSRDKRVEAFEESGLT